MFSKTQPATIREKDELIFKKNSKITFEIEKYKLDLKEDTINDSADSSFSDLDQNGDGLPDPNVYTSDEEVDVYDMDPITGRKKRNY